VRPKLIPFYFNPVAEITSQMDELISQFNQSAADNRNYRNMPRRDIAGNVEGTTKKKCGASANGMWPPAHNDSQVRKMRSLFNGLT
jgi:hypothetical protein